MKWIPVTERLPRHYGVVYVTIMKNGKRVVDTSYFNAESKVFVKDTYSDYKNGEVLAWMPFYKPNPWKVGNVMANEKGWYPGDYVKSNEKNSCFLRIRLMYLADSQLDYGCFIGKSEDGTVQDDYRLDEFDKEG